MGSGFLDGSLASNWRLKAVAFVMALFLWALVRVEAPDRRAVSVPVIVSLNDPDWMLIDDPLPSEVEVLFSGSPAEIFRLTALDGVAITVPVAEVRDREMVIALQDAWIPVDGYAGVTVEDILPGTVHVQFDHVETVSVPLRVITRGSLPEYLALTRSLSVTPSSVRISGPASIVQQLDSLDIVPVDLGEVDEQGAVQTAVDTTGLTRLTVVPNDVTLRVPVEESVDRVLAAVPVLADLGAELEEFGGALEILPATVELTLSGARTQVATLDVGRVRIVVPASELAGLAEAEERRVPIVVEGLPPYVSSSSPVDTVLVRREAQP